MKNKKMRAAFTLIELLVVIAIIALLAAILFPVFGRARENARRSSCQNNMKQLGLGMLQYAQDFDEYYPSSYATAGNNNSWMNQIMPYVKSKQIYVCPSNTVPKGMASLEQVSYSMPDNLNRGSFFVPPSDQMMRSGLAGWQRAHTQSAVEAASTTLMLVEYFRPWNHFNGDAGSEQVYAPSQNFPCPITNNDNTQDASTKVASHLEGWNYAFADGHVKWLRPEKTLGAGAGCNNGFPDNKGMWTINPND